MRLLAEQTLWTSEGSINGSGSHHLFNHGYMIVYKAQKNFPNIRAWGTASDAFGMSYSKLWSNGRRNTKVFTGDPVWMSNN